MRNLSVCLWFGVPFDILLIAGEGLQNFGLCSALVAFYPGGIFIVSYLLDLSFCGLIRGTVLVWSPSTISKGYLKFMLTQIPMDASFIWG